MEVVFLKSVSVKGPGRVAVAYRAGEVHDLSDEWAAAWLSDGTAEKSVVTKKRKPSNRKKTRRKTSATKKPVNEAAKKTAKKGSTP